MYIFPYARVIEISCGTDIIQGSVWLVYVIRTSEYALYRLLWWSFHSANKGKRTVRIIIILLLTQQTIGSQTIRCKLNVLGWLLQTISSYCLSHCI